MGIRRKFGPRFSATYDRPSSSEGKFDPSASLGYKAHRKGGPGKIHVDLSFQLPPFDPTQHNQLVAVHTVAYTPDLEIPTDPDEVVASTNPKSKVDSGIPTDGTELVVTVPHVPVGPVCFVTVLDYAEDDEPAPVADPIAATPPAPVADPIVPTSPEQTEAAAAPSATIPTDPSTAPADVPRVPGPSPVASEPTDPSTLARDAPEASPAASVAPVVDPPTTG